ncbi:MAG TPA: AMP-dependent synthetase [Syntrophus sp. (in: bacteria)]|nr:AMP-dependent synthetase [Syntrophus sp. (in: bacteria)]
MELRSFTVYDIFKRNARVFKNRTAIQSDEGRITFGELYERVNAVAGWLVSAGIRPGDRIAVLTKNRPEFFILAGAIAAAGAIMVPINFRLSAEEIGYNLTNTEPVAIVVDPDYEKTISDLRPACPSLRKRITFGPGGAEVEPFDSLLGGLPVNAVELSGDDPYIIMHTAAVQGKPRGAILSHHNLVSCSIQVIGALGLTHKDSYLNILPLFHIAGWMAALTVMHAGGRNLVVAKYDPKAAGKMIDREGVTFIGNFPPILTQLLDVQATGDCTLASLRNVIGVELPATVQRFEALGAGRFALAYGQTETIGLTCTCPNAERPGSAGRPGPLVDLMIADEHDREVAAGKPGEILVRGPLVFQGYWGEEELTNHTLREGWHHTGDVGRLDEEGFLWFVGRKAEKELIKPGGENVYPAEVEKVVLEHPAVLEVSVIGVPDPKFGEGIKAVCVLKPEVQLSVQELIDFVAGRIARYKKPNDVQFVDSLPRKEDGSIDRAKVKELHG